MSEAKPDPLGLQEAARDLTRERLTWAADLALDLMQCDGANVNDLNASVLSAIELVLEELAATEAKLGEALAMVNDATKWKQ